MNIRKIRADRLLQKTLAREVTIFIHGQPEYEQALVTTEKLFNQTGTAEDLSEAGFACIGRYCEIHFFY